MAKTERVREVLTEPLDPEYLRRRTEAGWRLVAVEWQRQLDDEAQRASTLTEDVPFGLRVAAGCSHLEEDPTERQVLMLMMDLIVQDHPLSKVAEELNQQGFQTRQRSKWNPVAVFNMLPRLIEVGPRIFSSEEWLARKRRLVNFA
jgi:Recombinase